VKFLLSTRDDSIFNAFVRREHINSGRGVYPSYKLWSKIPQLQGLIQDFNLGEGVRRVHAWIEWPKARKGRNMGKGYPPSHWGRGWGRGQPLPDF